MRFNEQWEEVPDTEAYENGFKLQWEQFIRHVMDDAPWRHDFLEGARGVRLAELGIKSWAERRWMDVPPLYFSLLEQGEGLAANAETQPAEGRWWHRGNI